MKGIFCYFLILKSIFTIMCTKCREYVSMKSVVFRILCAKWLFGASGFCFSVYKLHKIINSILSWNTLNYLIRSLHKITLVTLGSSYKTTQKVLENKMSLHSCIYTGSFQFRIKNSHSVCVLYWRAAVWEKHTWDIVKGCFEQ